MTCIYKYQGCHSLIRKLYSFKPNFSLIWIKLETKAVNGLCTLFILDINWFWALIYSNDILYLQKKLTIFNKTTKFQVSKIEKTPDH